MKPKKSKIARKTKVVATRTTEATSGRGATHGVPSKLTVADKRQAAFELRLEHHSEIDIARALGVTQPRVSQYLKEALQMRVDAANKLAPYIREMELERCDRMIFHWYLAAKTDIRSSELLLHWTERKHKILGLDVNKTELSGPNGGPVTISASALDLSKLNDEELHWLEIIVSKAGPKLTDDASVVSVVNKDEEELEEEDA